MSESGVDSVALRLDIMHGLQVELEWMGGLDGTTQLVRAERTCLKLADVALMGAAAEANVHEEVGVPEGRLKPSQIGGEVGSLKRLALHACTRIEVRSEPRRDPVPSGVPTGLLSLSLARTTIRGEPSFSSSSIARASCI